MIYGYGGGEGSVFQKVYMAIITQGKEYGKEVYHYISTIRNKHLILM